MPEKIEELIQAAFEAAQADGSLPAFEVDNFGLERPADPTNGDWSSTVAMRSAKLAHCAPRAIAEALVSHLPSDPVLDRAEVAGPGFINFYLSTAAANDIFARVRREGAAFGRSTMGAGTRVQVEFVSANPVGPLHIGHGRWAALGDSLCRVLEHAGFEVQREYYVNDHGSQMNVFGSSIAKRYEQLLELMDAQSIDVEAARAAVLADREAFVADEGDEHPELHPLTDAFNRDLGGNAYGGDYIVDLAVRFIAEDGNRWLAVSSEERIAEFRERAYRWMLATIEKTCADANCTFDLWFSERSLYEKDERGTSMVDRALARLDELGHLYRDEAGALWFRSTTFGDDKDRVLIKTDGDYTYFASDVAYHANKLERVDHVIDIWGADHHGYIPRVRAACDALGHKGQLEVLLGQLVNLLRDGQPVRMSKRRGTMVGFDELLKEVGCDATRYTLVSKSANQMIDFDIERAKKQDNTNPVYYVQYAHARICSILRRGAGLTLEEANELGMDEVACRAIGDEADLSLLVEPAEATLARRLSEFTTLVESCARDRAPFRLTHYAEELAADFHSFYTVCQVLSGKGRPLDEGLSKARLTVVDATRLVLAHTLNLIGVSAPQSM